MIGLLLGKRILGYQEFEDDSIARRDWPYEAEYVSSLKQTVFLPNCSPTTICKAFENDLCLCWDEMGAGGEVNPALGNYHFKNFMVHFAHLIMLDSINNYSVPQALSKVRIGSDFDGLINHFWICDTVDELGYFKDAFIREFPHFVGDCPLPLPAGLDARQFA